MADMIKKQYLGGEKLKKKMLKPSEKFKFNFDWEAGDDTSKDLNPLYNNTHEAQLLFGRGLRAGVDRREQKKVPKERLCVHLPLRFAFPLTSRHQDHVIVGAKWIELCCHEHHACSPCAAIGWHGDASCHSLCCI